MDEIDKLNNEKKQYCKCRNISLAYATIVIVYIVMFYVYVPTEIFSIITYKLLKVMNVLSIALTTAIWLAIMSWKDRLDREERGL